MSNPYAQLSHVPTFDLTSHTVTDKPLPLVLDGIRARIRHDRAGLHR
jgi:hypothetical protein